MADPNVVSPQVIEFLAGIATGYLAKEGENILEKSTDRIFESLKKKLGKDEFEKTKGMNKPEAKKALEALIKKKHLRKEVHAFYVIYKYLEKFTEDSQFLRVMDFRRGEGIPLDRMYVKLQIIEEQKKKDQLVSSKYYDEDYYYQAKEKWMRSEEQSRKVNPDEIMALDRGIVCILGLPGAGKTTLCKYFCWKTLKGDYARKRFPIYIELRGITKDEDPVTYALHSKLKEQFTKEEIEEAVATIRHNTDIFSPLYIFDGLDEVKVEDGMISESIRNCADSSLCIVTSRRSGFIYLQHDRTYEILPLGGDEKEEFVGNYFTQIEEVEKIESFLHVLEKKEYDSLSKNPLLLSILCALASDTEDVRTLPSRRSGLYKKIVGKMNEWHKSKGGKGLSQEEIRVLEGLALSLFLKKRPRILFEEEDIDEKILNRAARVGLIFRWDEVRYSFLHLTLQEYFAARSLGRLRRKWKEIVREKKDAVSWHEILQLFASILSEEEEYEELKEFFSIVMESPDILYLNYVLACHCLAEIDMDEVDGSGEILRNFMNEFQKSVCKNSFIEASVRLGDKAVDPLIDLLQRTDDRHLEWSISETLGEIGDKAVDSLIDLLQRTDDNDLERRISDALGEIRDPKAVDPLIDLLQRTDDDYLRVEISYALGKIKDPKAVDPLIDLLQRTDDNYLKWRIPEALGEIKDPKAVNPLIDLLQRTDDNYLREEISYALGEIGDKAVDSLIDLLQRTDDDYLKGRISDALGRTKDPRAVDPLIDLLRRTDDYYLKWRIPEALGEIKDPRAVDPLIDLLQRTDDERSMKSIFYALGEIGDKAVDPLIDLLQRTDDDYLKGRISDALGEIRDPKAVDPLIDLLQRTDDNYLRKSISYALGKIKDPKAVDPLIDLLQRTDDNYLRKSISDALGEIKDPKAVDPLIELLQRADDNLKWRISDALGKIKDPKAVDPLIDLLQRTDDNYLERRISDALGEIRDPKAVDPLIDLLQRTDDDYLKWSTPEALGEIGDKAVDPLIDLLQRTDDDYLKWSISDALGRIKDPKAVNSLIELLQRADDNLKWRISYALGKIKDPKAVDPLIDLLRRTSDDLREDVLSALGEIKDSTTVDSLIDILYRTDDEYLRGRVLEALRNLNPIHFYPFIISQVHQYIVLSVLCHFSTRFNVRFFKDKVVLPEGDILYIKTEAQKKHAIKKLDKILK